MQRVMQKGRGGSGGGSVAGVELPFGPQWPSTGPFSPPLPSSGWLQASCLLEA